MNKIEKSTRIFKALGDETRIRIIESIFEEPKNVTDIAQSLQMTHSAISHQLKILKDCDIVRSNRHGKNIFYYISDEHIKTVVESIFTHTMNCEVTS
ncbi:MAG: metalloregulator ArsR/SmtB family transcription factor [Bacilli bacterium]